VVDRETWGTDAETAEVPDQASTAGGEEGVRASQASHRIHLSSVHVLCHCSLQDVAACVVDTQEPLSVVASTQDLEDTSFQGGLGVEGPRSQVP